MKLKSFFFFLIQILIKYGDALVTSIHYDSPVDLIQLLLDKGANLASRNKEWVSKKHLKLQQKNVKD